MKKLLLLTLVMLLLSFMLFAQKAEKPMGKDCLDCNQQPMMKPGEVPQNDMMGMDMMKELNLTKEQQQKFEGMRLEHKKYMNTKQAEMENLRMDKQNAMRDGDYNKAKMLNKNIADLDLAIENAKVDHHMAMMKELTKEQQEKMKEMRAMKGGPMMKSMEPGQDKGMHKGPRN
jgi:Spy/CpxP family protein refolding chaperone